MNIVQPCPPHSWAHAPTVGYYNCSNCGERVDQDDPRYAEIRVEFNELRAKAISAQYRLDHPPSQRAKADDKTGLIDQMREAREAGTQHLHTITLAVKRMREMKSALQACEAYFEQRASAEYFTDSPDACGNEEMQLLVEVQQAIAGLPKEQAA